MFKPSISADIFALRPDFAALSLHVEGAVNRPSDAASAALLAEAISALAEAPWADAHLEAWRDAYRAFGAKPAKTPCSAEALRKRALRDGRIGAANAVVDLYNAVSLRYAVPVGGENARAYAGPPLLLRATGQEPFETMAEGLPRTEHPEPGEVIWCDARGVTCRRWNWRQGVRTRLEPETQDMWFVLERLEPMPLGALRDAGRALLQGLRALAPAAAALAHLHDAAHPEGAAFPL